MKMKSFQVVTPFCFLLLVLTLHSVCFGQKSILRPLTPEDSRRLESLWQTAVSADGQLLAYELQRSVLSGVSDKRDALHDLQRREIWIVPMTGGEAKKIAGGGDDGIGVWRPV